MGSLRAKPRSADPKGCDKVWGKTQIKGNDQDLAADA